jgi:hybrid cluster-associated redox disulfide protein
MIKKEMSIGEAVRAFPHSAKIMMQHGLHCIGCHVASYETIEEGCRGHGMSDEQIDAMIKEINAALSAANTPQT